MVTLECTAIRKTRDWQADAIRWSLATEVGHSQPCKPGEWIMARVSCPTRDGGRDIKMVRGEVESVSAVPGAWMIEVTQSLNP